MAASGTFRNKTVLVLGAGASNPYGFPLGVELKNFLMGNHNNAVFQAVQKIEHSGEKIEEFRDGLRYGTHPTIDVFLEKKRSLREIGSYFIAGAISGHEQHQNLFPQKEWYAYFFQILDFENLSRDMPDIAIVTLNYDRSLEHFLTKNIDYNCRDELLAKSHQRRQQLKIIHAHGSLGEFPKIPYGAASRDFDSLRQAAESIRIVSDRLDDSPDFRTARETLAGAKEIIFLGFGYNERTLAALLADVDVGKTQFFGTAVRLSDESKRTVSDFFQNKIILGGIGQDCTAFLRDTVLKR